MPKNGDFWISDPYPGIFGDFSFFPKSTLEKRYRRYSKTWDILTSFRVIRHQLELENLQFNLDSEKFQKWPIFAVVDPRKFGQNRWIFGGFSDLVRYSNDVLEHPEGV